MRTTEDDKTALTLNNPAARSMYLPTSGSEVPGDDIPTEAVSARKHQPVEHRLHHQYAIPTQ